MADKLIDRKDLDKAAAQVRAEVPAPIRFALDTVGPGTASWCQNVLASHTSVPHNPANPQSQQETHLICLSGRPKTANPSVRAHTVPIKLFHTNPELGSRVAGWLAELLASRELRLPETVFADGGLDVVGSSLERIKKGEVSGRRLVVRLAPSTGAAAGS